MMHTILGAGGPISNALAKELLQNGENVRLVSRRPVQTAGHASWMKADLKDYRQVLAAVTGSDVLYLCAGLRYDSQVWAREWPLIMQNVIEATKATGARLISFDNVYLYGPVSGAMTEESPCQPSSKKGEIRARIASQHDYVFRSEKFEEAFGLLPTSYADGMKGVSQTLFKRAKAA